MWGALQAVVRLADGHEVEQKVLEPAIMQLAEAFVEGACAFGCGMVRRRKGRRLEPSDMSDFLERNWWATVVHARPRRPCKARCAWRVLGVRQHLHGPCGQERLAVLGVCWSQAPGAHEHQTEHVLKSASITRMLPTCAACAPLMISRPRAGCTAIRHCH